MTKQSISGADTHPAADDTASSRVLARTVAPVWINVTAVSVALILYAVAWPTLHVTHAVPPIAQPLIAALAAFPVMLVRAEPAIGWAISAGSALVIALVIPHQATNDIPFQVVHIIALFTLLFAVVLQQRLPVVAVAWGATSLLLATTMSTDDGAQWVWPVALAAVVLVGVLLRWLVQSRRQLLQQEEVNELERARRTILEEKARIARDLHDVVAHHMSLVVVQAQTAAYRVDDVTPGARKEFESIGATAREALNEVRSMLGVLRSDGQLAEHTPQPRATDVLALCSGASRAGVEVSWTVDGALETVPDTVGLALYRIAQEALSNAARHAPGAPIRVHIVCAESVDLTVTNEPSTTTPGGLDDQQDSTGQFGHGHGIEGMNARAVAVGGQLSAGPSTDGGFEVRAHLPRTSAVSVPGEGS